jgi:hypothetical protein
MQRLGGFECDNMIDRQACVKTDSTRQRLMYYFSSGKEENVRGKMLKRKNMKCLARSTDSSEALKL